MAVVNINQILDWFRTGKKPTQAQFWATWGSFWHKQEGIVIKHPTQEEIEDNVKTLEVLTLQGNVKIPKSGNYTGSMEDLEAQTTIVPFSKLTIYKKSGNNLLKIAETGDYVQGWFSETKFIRAWYLGGPLNEIESFDLLEVFEKSN